jgi:putative membrane protein
MLRLFVHWILNAVALLLVAHFVPGFYVRDFSSALVAVIIIGLLNATIGLLLKIVTFPLGILTLGLFFLIINALVLYLASGLSSGFRVVGFAAAFWGALALAILHMLFRAIEGEN